MIHIDIPGFKNLKIENIVFDYNGTIAHDGKMSDEIREMIIDLKKDLNVYVATADTHGSVEKECTGLGITIKKFPKENAAKFKREIVRSLGAEHTICVGNGLNDIEMSIECVVSIAVIGPEGCSGKLISNCDIVVNSINDVFGLLANTGRIKATLRT